MGSGERTTAEARAVSGEAPSIAVRRPADPDTADAGGLAEMIEANQEAAAAALATRAPMLQGPKRQHFLPRFYLEGFCRDGLVAVFDRDQNEVRRQQPINTAVIGHFYTQEDEEGRRRFELEAALSEVEGKAKPVIDKLVAQQGVSDEERGDLALFMALACMRTPDMVNSVQALNGQILAHTAKIVFHDEERLFERLRIREKEVQASDEALREMAAKMVGAAQNEELRFETDQKWAVQMAMRMAIRAAPYVAARHWRVVHRDSDKLSFITTDAPVYLNTTSSEPSPYGVGLGSADAFISFPLSQSCVLQAWGDGGTLEHKTGARDYIRRANLALGEHCQRFVLGRDEALVRSIATKLGLAQKRWQSKLVMA